MDKKDNHGTFEPYVPAVTTLKDFTLKALAAGVVFGALFGSANAYLGLRVGLTIGTAIPLAVVSVALFRALKPVLGPSSILEWNIAQTTGSASSSLASGIIFTIPALFLWGFSPSLYKIATLAALGGVLGVLFMIPLRRFLIVKEHGTLPYPEGTAAAQVLIVSDAGGTKAKNVFLGLGVGAVYKTITGFFHLWPDRLSLKVPVMHKAEIGLEAGPALLGVGYILGYRIAAIMVAGGLLSWLGVIPLIAHFGQQLGLPVFPETSKTIMEMSPGELWDRYVRYVGAGAVATAGIITVIRSLPTMLSSLGVGLHELRMRSAAEVASRERTDRDLPMFIILIGIALITLVVIVSPNVVGVHSSTPVRMLAAICMLVFAFMFVTVSSRIVGLVGVSSNPTSGMAIVTLIGTSLLFLIMGWTDAFGMAAALTVGTVVCVSASIAGDISQDLKAGFLIGATPRKQQTAELIGALSSAFFIAGAVWLLGKAFTFGSRDLPAPQATLMKTVIEGVLSGSLPWSLVLTGAAFAAVSELLGVPSLPFAVGIYLPLSTMTPVFVGGVLRGAMEKWASGGEEVKSRVREQGILLGSGLIAGEGLVGVLVALYAFIVGRKPIGVHVPWPGATGSLVSLAAFAALGYFLLKMSSARGRS